MEKSRVRPTGTNDFGKTVNGFGMEVPQIADFRCSGVGLISAVWSFSGPANLASTVAISRWGTVQCASHAGRSADNGFSRG
jgi:hypothetical protein